MQLVPTLEANGFLVLANREKIKFDDTNSYAVRRGPVDCCACP